MTVKIRMPARGYVRIAYNKKNRTGRASLTVPAPLAALVSEDALFRAELTEDGILFRYVDGQQSRPVPPTPAWLQEGRS